MNVYIRTCSYIQTLQNPFVILWGPYIGSFASLEHSHEVRLVQHPFSCPEPRKEAGKRPVLSQILNPEPKAPPRPSSPSPSGKKGKKDRIHCRALDKHINVSVPYS